MVLDTLKSLIFVGVKEYTCKTSSVPLIPMIYCIASLLMALRAAFMAFTATSCICGSGSPSNSKHVITIGVMCSERSTGDSLTYLLISVTAAEKRKLGIIELHTKSP